MSLGIQELKTLIQTTTSQLRKEQYESYTWLEAGLDTVKDGARVLENRILSLEQNASTSGDHSHREILKKDMAASIFKIKCEEWKVKQQKWKPGTTLQKYFKEHIPDEYSAVHSDFIRMGIYLREVKTITTRIRFVHHTMQLQGEKAGEDDIHIFQIYTPNADDDIEEIWEDPKYIAPMALIGEDAKKNSKWS